MSSHGLSAQEIGRRVRTALVSTGTKLYLRPVRDPEFGGTALRLLERRFLPKDQAGTPIENPDAMFRRIAQHLSLAEFNYGSSDADRQAAEDKFYQVMRSLEFLPNALLLGEPSDKQLPQNPPYVDVAHPGILEFLNPELTRTLPIGIPGGFIEKTKEGGSYELIHPESEEAAGQLNARDVFNRIAAVVWKTGNPGLLFLDKTAFANPFPVTGAVNLTRLIRSGCWHLEWQSDCSACQNITIDQIRLVSTVHTAVHLLDNALDVYPVLESQRQTRSIGIGVMGFADLLIQLGVRYDSATALGIAEELMKSVQGTANTASEGLALKRGTFSDWQEGVPKRRNATVSAIAPAGTTSIIAGVSSGIEPISTLSYESSVMGGTRLVESHPYFKAVAVYEGLYSDAFMARLAERGTLQELDVPAWVKDVFRTSRDISPEWHVAMQAAFEKYTDSSVAKTINFPHEATVEDVARIFILAYDSGCKEANIYRESREGVAERIPFLARFPRERSRISRGLTERVRTGHGNMYVTINFDDQGMPFEVFGTLGKAGGCDAAQLEAISRLVSLALRSGIDPQVITEQLRGITCCPAWDSGTLVRSGPDAIAIALERNRAYGSPESS